MCGNKTKGRRELVLRFLGKHVVVGGGGGPHNGSNYEVERKSVPCR